MPIGPVGAGSAVMGLFPSEVIGRCGSKHSWSKIILKLCAETSRGQLLRGVVQECVLVRIMRRMARRRGHFGEAWRECWTATNGAVIVEVVHRVLKRRLLSCWDDSANGA